MSLAALITSLRTLAQDGPADHVVFDEQLGGGLGTPLGGGNTHFRLKLAPVVTGSVYVTTVGGAFRSQTGFTVPDLTNGIITFTVAPAADAQILVDYNYQWFTDAKYTEFLNESSSMLQLNAAVDPTTVPAGLVPPMLQYALAHFFKARASQYQERYSSSGGEAGQSVESVAKGYAALAKAAEKRGDDLRDAFYKKQGQSLTPAYVNPTTHPAPGFDPITPRR